MRTIFVTGGAGFIGSTLVKNLHRNTSDMVVNIDKLTYAGDLESLSCIANDSRYTLESVDICDVKRIYELFEKYRPYRVLHLAAESHVDRSISSPMEFIETNVKGTCVLLECSRRYYETLSKEEKDSFRFLHVSTDEVYGYLGSEGFFTETTPYSPSSPYSASKAASDHMVRAWNRTYGIPTIVTNCSNNYGPWQFPEKLIPVTIISALNGQAIPVYGDGSNVRDWLFVEDHVQALWSVCQHGKIGETYNIGGHGEKSNLEIVKTICSILDDLQPSISKKPYSSQITFIKDRLGHDFRYAIDSSKIKREIRWFPTHTLEEGLRETVKWYIEHQQWCKRLQKKRG